MASCDSIESLLNQLIDEVNTLKAKAPNDLLGFVLGLINELRQLITDLVDQLRQFVTDKLESFRNLLATAINALRDVLVALIDALSGRVDREVSDRQSADSVLAARLEKLESRMAENEAKTEATFREVEKLTVLMGVVAGTLALHESRIERLEAELIGLDGNVVQAIEAVKTRALEAISATEGRAFTAISVVAGASTSALAVVTSTSLAAIGTAATLATGAIAASTATGTAALAAATTTSAAAIAAEAATATAAITTTSVQATASMKAIELALVIAATATIAKALELAIAALEPKVITVDKPFVVTQTQIQLVDKPVVITQTETQVIDRPVVITQTETQVIDRPVVITQTETQVIDRPVVITQTETQVVEKPVVITQTETQVVEKPVVITQTETQVVEKPVVIIQTETQVVEKPVVIIQTETKTETRVEVEIREIEKEKTITKLPTCEELQGLQDCLPEKTVTKLPTCAELQQLEDCWPTDKVRLPYVTFPLGADEPKTLCPEFGVLRRDRGSIPVQKYIDSADIAMTATHQPMGVPEWWEVRVGSGRPQAILIFRECASGTQCMGVKKKYGKGVWSLTIPHYNKPKGFKPQIPDYQKGDFEGVLTLKDNSKLVVNCISTAECKRVINALKPFIDPKMLPIKGGLKVGERNGVYKKVKVTATRLKFYHAGQQEFDPKKDFVVRLV
jgi:hypothetical protein